MGYIAAALNKHGEDASETILTMLRAAGTNPAQSYGIADHRNTETGKTPDYSSQDNSLLLASKNIFPERYPSEPLHQGDHSLVFNGILLDTVEPDTLSAADTLQKDPAKGIEKLIAQRTGAYAVAAITKDSIFAGIDHIGTIPLYYGENKDYRAIATNKKMLWSINLESTPLKPGHIIKITETQTNIAQIKPIETPVIQATTPEKIHKIMNETSREYASKTPYTTVAFSGGIDSLLTSYYLQQNNIEPELIWAGLENQEEQCLAHEAADHLGLRLRIETHTIEEVEETLDIIINSIEEPDPVKTGIAYPFYWASKKTYEMGYTTMYSGNGADELFAGYMRYLQKYLNGIDPSNDILEDVANSYLQNFHRDTKTCLDQGIRLLLPFTHPRRIEYGLSIPIQQKLPETLDQPRKKILRQLAKTQGIPDKLADRPKKAAQYSSGVNKSLVKIAKKHGMSLRELTEKKYQELRVSRE